MEDGLVHFIFISILWTSNVLILVVMEDGLVQLKKAVKAVFDKS